MIWVLVGVNGCVLRPTGHSSVTLFPCLCRLRTDRCIRHRGQVIDLLSRAHTWVWAQGRLVALLSWIWLFLDRLIGGGDGGGPCTTLTPGLRSGGLESKFGWGPRPRDRRVMGWSYLCLGYKRGVCFWGTQLGALIRESPGNPVRLVSCLAP